MVRHGRRGIEQWDLERRLRGRQLGRHLLPASDHLYFPVKSPTGGVVNNDGSVALTVKFTNPAGKGAQGRHESLTVSLGIHSTGLLPCCCRVTGCQVCVVI